MANYRFRNKLIMCFAFMFCICAFLMFFSSAKYVYAEDVVYSDVLDDLQKDEKFNVEDYPTIADDFNLYIIQIAESETNELFIYVYSPSASLETIATHISISTSFENPVWNLYELQYLNSSNVFFKYKVKNLSISENSVRYYDISEIFRKWNENFDHESGSDNVIDEVSFEVAQSWSAVTFDGQVIYQCIKTDVVTITDKWCGFRRFTNDWFWVKKNTDSWFVAFSTDKSIDKLIEADVYYSYRTFSNISMMETVLEDNPNDEEAKSTRDYDQVEPLSSTVHLIYTQKASATSGGLFSHKYTWQRIQSVDSFISENKSFRNNVNLVDKDWILHFVETPYTVKGNSALTSTVKGTEIGEVSILRLKFETDGIVYNLGVVDNLQSPDKIPDDVVSGLPLWAIALIVLGGLILLPFIIASLPYMIKVIWFVLKYIFIVFWWLVQAPFSLFFD